MGEAAPRPYSFAANPRLIDGLGTPALRLDSELFLEVQSAP